MFDVKATVFGLINGMLTLLVSLIWEMIAQSVAGVNGQPTMLLLWLAGNVMLMGIVLKEFNRRPKPLYIVKQGLLAPFWLGLYANYLISQFHRGSDDTPE